MDNDFSVDLAELVRTLETSDVVTVRFMSLPQRLLFDFRATDLDGPIVRLVDPVRTLRERYESLERLRPRMDAPEQIVLVLWPGYARSLEATEVWGAAVRRIESYAGGDDAADATATLRELVRRERAYQRAAVRGEGFRTLWSSPMARD
jgi:hypothetical protein